MRFSDLIRLLLIFTLSSKLGSCKDFSSLGASWRIEHGKINTKSDSKYQLEEEATPRIILRETVLTTDHNIYVAFMKRSCMTDTGLRRIDCLFLRIYKSYDNLRKQNCEKELNKQCSNNGIDYLSCRKHIQLYYKYTRGGVLSFMLYNNRFDLKKLTTCRRCHACWQYKYIKAKCQLATMQIVHGFIICETLVNNGQHPKLAKIDLNTGNLLGQKTLDKAKLNTKCSNSYNKCTVRFNDVNVLIMVDNTTVWALYNTERNGILEQIDINNLESTNRIKIDLFESSNRAIIISNKLYILSFLDDQLSIIKALDIYDSKNRLSHKITLLRSFEGVTHNLIHYNPRLEQLFIGQYPKRESFIYTVNKCPYDYPTSRELDVSTVNSTFLWSIYSNDLQHYIFMIQTITNFLQVKDNKKLRYIKSILLTCPYTGCQNNNMSSQLQCRLNNIRSIFESYATYKDSVFSTKLQVHFDMIKLLEQNQFRQLSNKLHVLQSMINSNFVSIKKEIHSLRSSLGSYFSAFANFDLRKSKADLELFYSAFNELNVKQNKIASTIKHKFKTLFHQALGSNFAEIAGQMTNVAVASAAFGNPFSFFKGTGIVLELQDRLADLAKAKVDLVKLTRIAKVYFPRLRKINEILIPKIRAMANKFPNLKYLVTKAMDKTLNDHQIAQRVNLFLNEYDSYRPAYEPSTIDEYEAVLELIVNELCRIIYSGKSLSAAISQGVLASKGTCLATKIDVQTLMGLYRDMYDKQYYLMNAFAAAVRETAARINSEKIKNIPSEIKSGKFQETEINYKLSALEILLNSMVHTLLITREACTLIKYKNGDVMPRYCKDAIDNAGFSSGDSVISTRLNRDMCDGVNIQKLVYIPVQYKDLNSSIPPGTVDLTRLYRGDGVTFQISNAEWLIKHKWIYPGDKNKMIVLKEFGLFIPTNSSSEIFVRTSLRYISQNVIQPGGKSNDFNAPKLYEYVLQYNQGTSRCDETLLRSMPYDFPSCPKLPKICLISKGKMSHPTIYPSIYSKFKLKLSTKGKIQTPEPKTKFYFIASVRLCIVEPVANKRKRSKVNVKNIPIGGTRKANQNKQIMCCGSLNEYYDVLSSENRCQACPKNSTAKFAGLYCE